MERNMIAYAVVDSTNSEASRLISRGKIRGSCYIVADYQNHGRGQGEHVWVSEAGKNLLLSWCVFPAFLSVNDQFQLSKAVCLAVSDLLNQYQVSCNIKWPNDILTGLGKIGGILIEHSLMGSKIRHSIIGIGLNINQAIFPEFPFKASSMILELGREIDLEEFRNRLADYLEGRFSQLRRGEMDQINSEYLSRLYRLNAESVFSDGVVKFRGRIIGVSDLGELQVETNDGVSTFGFHQIMMLQ